MNSIFRDSRHNGGLETLVVDTGPYFYFSAWLCEQKDSTTPPISDLALRGPRLVLFAAFTESYKMACQPANVTALQRVFPLTGE